MKKAFTLIELLIVVMIIGFLFGISYRIITSQNLTEQYAFGVGCGNYLNRDIQEFINKASRKQGIQTGNNTATIFPDYYIIDFDTNSGDVKLRYRLQDQESNYVNLIHSTGYTVSKEKCNSSKYDIVLSGVDTIIQLTKGFKSNTYKELSSFKITEPINAATGSILLQSCDGVFCVNTTRFNISVARQEIQREVCRTYEDDAKTTCSKWK